MTIPITGLQNINRNQFLTEAKNRLFNLITVIRQVNNQITEHKKINDSYDKLIDSLSSPKNKNEGFKDCNLKKIKNNSAKNIKASNPNNIFKNNIETLRKKLMDDKQKEELKLKQELEEQISSKKKEIELKKEELEQNNKYEIDNLQESIKYLEFEKANLLKENISIEESNKQINLLKKKLLFNEQARKTILDYYKDFTFK